jgi:glycosyltransferase involved in cell wall biosynthesis
VLSNKISIITVTFDCIETIENTIKSTLNQTYKNVEYIIIDGGSSDGTVDVIKKYEDYIFLWMSEPDRGIYDAMNKGIVNATGDYILFLNSGDLFYSVEVLANIFSHHRNSDVIYGDTLVIDNVSDKKVIRAADLKSDWKSIPYCHQSVFVKTKVLKKKLFNISYNVASDYNQYFQLKNSNCSFLKIDEIISIYDLNGFSIQNYVKLLYEYKSISVNNQKNYIFKNFVLIYYNMRIFKNKYSKCLSI